MNIQSKIILALIIVALILAVWCIFKRRNPCGSCTGCSTGCCAECSRRNKRGKSE